MYKILHIPTALYVVSIEEPLTFDYEYPVCAFRTKKRTSGVLHEYVGYSIYDGDGICLWKEAYEPEPNGSDKPLLIHEFEIIKV